MTAGRDTISRVAACVAGLALALPAVASGHVERPGYFPDPDSDTSVSPPAGGGVPEPRTLASALDDPGTRVVCRPDSLTRARDSIANAQTTGYQIRPSDGTRFLSAAEAANLAAINESLYLRCGYDEIQPAVNDSGNNGRVVVMPGIYLEPTARAQPTHDPACDEYRTDGDRPGSEGDALSYAYQLNCPNDQNLIAVMGREIGPGTDPVPPRHDRNGIPNLGPCVRCNLQLEGSGVSADDVVIEAGDASKGNGGPNGVGSAKDVAIRADRADGFVLRNLTVRHAGEHGIYVLETDGYLLDRFKAFYSRLYGTLTFVADHGLQQNCEAVGHGDSGVYPGAAPETGDQREEGTERRLNQEIRFCDLHHNLAGYSGTNGNAVHVRDNAIYGNSLGIQTDVVTGAGHPGYPGDSMLVENNLIHSNNFNPYDEGSDIRPSFPFPVGTGMWIAGGNSHTIRNNRFFDNWRRGTMLFAVPDSLICGPHTCNTQAGCEPFGISTSNFNSQHGNRMGERPSGQADPNGTDFWWDSFPGNLGNCWWGNTGPAPIRSDPPILPDCLGGTEPNLSVGTGNPAAEAELVICFVAFETRNFDPNGPCPWFRTPDEPGPGGGSPLTLRGSGAWTTRASRIVPPVQRDPVPLGQITCTEWRSARGAERDSIVSRVRAFAGDVVIGADRAVGKGAVLRDRDAKRLYDGWCGRPYASGFLLYKLYTWGAALAPRR